MQKNVFVTSCDNSGGNCVEVIDNGMTVIVRDKHGATVTYDYAEWDTFILAAADGIFTRTVA